MAISKDKKKIEELLSRGVENIYPSKEFLRKRLQEGKQLTLYTGYDPTAPTLHVGHGITLLKLRQFQNLGHKIIILIGDFTGMIGDPTDKSAARQRLTRKQVLENAKMYKKQASKILNLTGKNKAEIKYNSKWLGKMSFADVVELGSHFTVQRMMERDMFEKRMKDGKPIYVHEFMYPMMQGYDCVAMDVDGEVGGNDQTFNMLAGRSLMKDLKKKEKFVLTTRLLTDTTGAKMGKTTGNMIAFNDAPEDIYGKVMSWNDEMIVSGFELCTQVSIDKINKIKNHLKVGKNPRDAKAQLAFEITALFTSPAKAKTAEKHFAKTFQKKENPDDMAEVVVAETVLNIIDALVHADLASSKSDARRVIQGGGVKVDNKKIIDPKSDIKINKQGVVVQKGKRFFARIMLG